MRRVLGLSLAALLIASGSSTALAITRQQVTIKALIADAAWEAINEDTGAGEIGAVEFATSGGKTTVSIAMSKGELVLCEGAETPDDEFDDVYGFVGTETSGEGSATLAVGRTYSSATAKGRVTADVFTFDECTGDEGTSTTKTFDVSLALDGLGPVVTEKLHSTVKIPKQLRSKTLAKATSREAAGTVKVGSRSIDVGGVIGQLQMKASITQR